MKRSKEQSTTKWYKWISLSLHARCRHVMNNEKHLFIKVWQIYFSTYIHDSMIATDMLFFMVWISFLHTHCFVSLRETMVRLTLEIPWKIAKVFCWLSFISLINQFNGACRKTEPHEFGTHKDDFYI